MTAAVSAQLPAAPPPSTPAPRRQSAAARPTAAVATIIVVLFFGAQLVNGSLPARAGGAVDIGPLRLELAPGWEFSQTEFGPRLAKGAVAVDIASLAYSGTPVELYDDFVAEALVPYASGFGATPAVPLTLDNGLGAVRGTYVGIFGVGEVEGQLTALTVAGWGVVFDAWGRSGTLRAVLSEVEQMIDGLAPVE